MLRWQKLWKQIGTGYSPHPRSKEKNPLYMVKLLKTFVMVHWRRHDKSGDLKQPPPNKDVNHIDYSNCK